MAGESTIDSWQAIDLALSVQTVLLFGGAFPAIKAGLDYFPPLLFAAIRYGLSAALLLGYAVATGHEWLPGSGATGSLCSLAARSSSARPD